MIVIGKPSVTGQQNRTGFDTRQTALSVGRIFLEKGLISERIKPERSSRVKKDSLQTGGAASVFQRMPADRGGPTQDHQILARNSTGRHIGAPSLMANAL